VRLVQDEFKQMNPNLTKSEVPKLIIAKAEPPKLVPPKSEPSFHLLYCTYINATFITNNKVLVSFSNHYDSVTRISNK
jgi:hypothetical protein